MEIGFLVLVLVSASSGVLVRKRITVTVARMILVAGFIAAVLGVLIVALVAAGWFPFWFGAISMVALFTIGGLLFPFGLTASVGRRW